MIHVDPAHPSFVNLPLAQRAQIYVSMGWNQTAISEELGCHQATVRYWTDPDYRERKKADALKRFHASRQQRGEGE